MPSIRRTMFIGNEKDQIRLWDWYRVDTNLGPMYEARPILLRTGYQTMDPPDMMVKVDALEFRDKRAGQYFFDYDKFPSIKLHGGNVFFQTDNYT